jgi:putative glutathione S-transferase
LRPTIIRRPCAGDRRDQRLRLRQREQRRLSRGLCGIASAYEAAFRDVFGALDKLEARLSQQRYLVGNSITEADWRLFVTLARFDAAYYGQFKCNLRRLIDYPNLSNYLRDLYQVPGVAATVDLQHIKQGYYRRRPDRNPVGLIPLGPALDFSRRMTG